MMEKAFVSVFGFLCLLCLQALSSEARNITIAPEKCFQTANLYRCIVRDLVITKDDLKNTFWIPDTEKPAESVKVKFSKMFFIPSAFFTNYTKNFTASGNQIEEIYFETFNGANLTQLDLSLNRIRILIDFAFTHCEYLEFLNLQHNKIDFVSSTAFYGLVELKTLLLSHNNIIHLPLFLFSSLLSIRGINIDHNLIEIISYDHFSGHSYKHLQSLSLEGNRISIIDNGSFENAASLTKLELGRNLCIDFNFNNWPTANRSELYCCVNKTDETCVMKVYPAEETHSLIGITTSIVAIFIVAILAGVGYKWRARIIGNEGRSDSIKLLPRLSVDGDENVDPFNASDEVTFVVTC